MSTEQLSRLLLEWSQQQQKGNSPYLAQFREEHRVIPSVAGLPRIIRQFPVEVQHA